MMFLKKIISVLFLLSYANYIYSQEINLPQDFNKSFQSVSVDKIGNHSAVTEIVNICPGILRVNFTFELGTQVQQDDWQVNIEPAFIPAFNWSPHLTPTDRNIIDQHVFRSPALIIANEEQVVTIIPDLDIIKNGMPVRWYMDMDAQRNRLTLGMSNSKLTGHVLYERNTGAFYPKGRVEFGFYILRSFDEKDKMNPFRKALDFLWTKWGSDLYQAGNPLSGDLSPYVKHTYNWAFKSWAKSVWQEFSLGEKIVGAPAFIVNTTQSPNYQGEINEREFRSIWNQAWFSSLRSASGLYRYAKRTNDKELMKKARMTKELALLFPQKEGFFYGLIGTEMEEIEIDGKKYNRSKGWDTYYWGNSNRNPYTWDPRNAPFHILDMSWTALLMLRWYEELEKDERLIEYAEKYGKALLDIQEERGFFPGWVDVNTLDALEYLNDSPETSMSVTFLLKLYQLTAKEEYKKSALKAMDAVIDEIITTGRWEDFETYWSCCRIGTPEWIGKKVKRNNMYKQCNFSMFWTTEALLECYLETKNKKYLDLGQRTLDEMLMTQSSWQPPYIYVKALGGFGVMNSDGEWNDSRGSLFAEIILQYGKLLDKPEYKERGISALRASFAMMYCPENPIAKQQWEKVWPFFNKEDYGFTMENYGHGGQTNPDGMGIGEFTIYDWGNGAASEAYNRILDKLGEEFIND